MAGITPVAWRTLGFLLLLAVAFALDHPAFGFLRTVTLYDHSGEVREALMTAKFLSSGLGTLLIAVSIVVADRRMRRRALALLLAVTTAAAAGAAIKMLSGRERPSHLDQPVGRERLAFHGPAAGLRQAPFQSFPSGHTVAAFASATALATFYPAARVLFFAVAGGTAVNRVVKHQHFLSDVVAGALLGNLVASFVLRRPTVRRLWSRNGGSQAAEA